MVWLEHLVSPTAQRIPDDGEGRLPLFEKKLFYSVFKSGGFNSAQGCSSTYVLLNYINLEETLFLDESSKAKLINKMNDLRVVFSVQLSEKPRIMQCQRK